MAKEFDNKTIFITGAAKGQGRAVALAFAEEGANIIAFDLGERIPYPAYNRSSNDDLEKLKSDVEAAGGKILIYAGDVRKAEDLKEAVDRGVKEFGGIDILFSNAGIAAYGYSWELTEEQWDALIDVNLKGGFLASKYVIPHMIEKKSGVIIYNSSVGGLRGFNRMSHYSASKHGLVGLTKSQAIELAPYGVRVVSLHPTGVNTPMNDGLAELEGTTAIEIAERSAGNLLKTPWLETEDIVEAVKYIASDRARYLTGSQFVLDAGLLTR
ncbi:mycofactocin-coupled SDR family oxidoreductase [Butyrivibrio sp. WCD3002]|jgi:NAD(P)-dependent dehydrogenase (short-subunit alcohol dehydrogenase family)|uniref:mycofactocin-coupled SDR family oxidoreductase n=1 Tax=Butyrivibrio sp. WCD3002 TaxID=1280676 RepID=UPI000426FF39|nr:mycofactocin-coupled SDR family oxidoreductase [Butyrivibrio sp. WCD3002]